MSITPAGNADSAPPPWGTFAPQGYRRFLRGLVALGLARGGLKRWFYRQWITTSGNTPADIITHGLRLRLHPHDNTTESKLLLGSRSRDHEELSFLNTHLPPGGTFLDVGANIGFYSLIATARGAARTLAVEPLPVAFQRLQFNIRANGFEQRITALQAALGAERKRVTITAAEGDLGSSSIVKTGIAGKAVEVPMLPLADALSENGFTRVDGMKIDVEGMEDSVLCPFFKSAPRTLWPGCVIMEDVHRGDWKQDVLAAMMEAGYRHVGAEPFECLAPPGGKGVNLFKDGATTRRRKSPATRTLMNVTPSASRDLTGRRILVGPNEIAGFTSRIAVALARSGAQVRFFNGHEHPFNPQVAESEQLRRLFGRIIGAASRWQERGSLGAAAGMLVAGLAKTLTFAQACFWAQTVVMVGGKGFFGGGLEYAFLRLLGKRVVHVFIGTASRPRYLSGYAKGVMKDGRINPKELKRLARRTRRQAARIRGISRHASVVIENPLCGHFYERPFVNFFKLGAPLDVAALERQPRLTDATPSRVEGKIRVLHCPSRPEIKGSARIQAVMEKLIGEGVPLEFRQLTGIPRAQVLHEITLCDFVVDELYSDSPMAGFAAEASAFGKAAIVGGYGWKLFGEFLRPEEVPPTPTCHPDELEAAIRLLAANAPLRNELGLRARAFLQSQWSEAAFAERFARVVTGEIPQDWWMHPEQVCYWHGLGLEEKEARQLIGALVEQFGSGALQLEHVPGLRDRLVAFGRGAPAAY